MPPPPLQVWGYGGRETKLYKLREGQMAFDSRDYYDQPLLVSFDMPVPQATAGYMEAATPRWVRGEGGGVAQGGAAGPPAEPGLQGLLAAARALRRGSCACPGAAASSLRALGPGPPPQPAAPACLPFAAGTRSSPRSSRR
jgi:hypothetical protein